jgi:membrane protease YdiL (CAAX protease family)
MPSAGFIVLTIIAIMLIIVPSILIFTHGWRSGKISRVLSILAFLLLIIISWLSFTDNETPGFEARAFNIYVVWGVTLYVGVLMYGCLKIVQSFVKRKRA